MNWKAISKNCVSSEEGYLLSKYALEHGAAYVARSPTGKILHSGTDLAKAKTVCVDHFEAQKGKAA